MNDWNNLVIELEKLTGQKTDLNPQKKHKISKVWPLGYSQLNEMLLFLGLDRISEVFFKFLSRGVTNKRGALEIESITEFKKAVELFQKIALYEFGNVKFAFKLISNHEDFLDYVISNREPYSISEYKNRHEQFIALNPIPEIKTHYLGYITQGVIKESIKRNPKDEKAIEEQEELEKWTNIGEKNQEVYLASDHLDIYVATSMRESHEFIFVNRLTKKIFSNDKLKPLNLRWFDPTQAYTPNRLDKGLSEALMLKRAMCTLYLVQETDTFGKDSELASTLAQGKPVIAFIPKGDKGYVNNLIKDLKEINPNKGDKEIILDQLQIFNPSKAWKEKSFRKLLDTDTNVNQLKEMLFKEVKIKYDKRANMLINDHPLAIQTNLETGVANGVLVVRTISNCCSLIKDIVTN